jgi:O-antigen ligase
MWLIRLYLVSAGLFALTAIGMYLTSEYGRLTGTFYWANPAAAYLIPAIILSLDGIRRSAGRRTYAWTALAAGFATAFLLTDSRAATAVLALIVVLYLALVKLSKRFWINFLFALALAWGASMGLVKISSVTTSHTEKAVPGSRLTEAIKGESSSGSDRLFYLGSALEMWKSQPLVGIGAGAYGDVHPSYQQRVVSASANAHNVYVQILAELGAVGAMLLLGLLAVLGLGILRGLVEKPDLVPLALGAAGLLIHFGLDIDAAYPALLMLVGIFAGVIYTQNSIKWVKSPAMAPIAAILILIPVVSA